MVNIKEMPKLIKGLTYEDVTRDVDWRLHYDANNFYWSARTKEEYKVATDKIDAIKYSGEGWELYAWYDVSGYDYWVVTMREQNYIQITIALETADLPAKEVNKMKAALQLAMEKATEIQVRYDFQPDSIEAEQLLTSMAFTGYP